jgi:hypothetical protein
MTGEGVVLTEEDRAAVDHAEQELLAELGPRTILGRFLVHQMAVYMTRLTDLQQFRLGFRRKSFGDGPRIASGR